MTINVLEIQKGEHRYVFRYDVRSFPQLLQTFGLFAADPNLNFTWYDAVVLSRRARERRDAPVVTGSME